MSTESVGLQTPQRPQWAYKSNTNRRLWDRLQLLLTMQEQDLLIARPGVCSVRCLDYIARHDMPPVSRKHLLHFIISSARPLAGPLTMRDLLQEAKGAGLPVPDRQQALSEKIQPSPGCKPSSGEVVGGVSQHAEAGVDEGTDSVALEWRDMVGSDTIDVEDPVGTEEESETWESDASSDTSFASLSSQQQRKKKRKLRSTAPKAALPRSEEWFTVGALALFVRCLFSGVPFLDPCTCQQALELEFISPAAFITENSLGTAWRADYVYCNPPFRLQQKFVLKFLSEFRGGSFGNGVIVLPGYMRESTKQLLISAGAAQFCAGSVPFYSGITRQVERKPPFDTWLFAVGSVQFKTKFVGVCREAWPAGVWSVR